MLKSLLMNVKEEWKSWLKLNIQKTMITKQQIGGQTMETVKYFYFLGSKITADDDCSPEIKRHLLLGRKAMTNLDSELKSRAITLLTKLRLVKAMVFPVVMCGCESWTIEKAEHLRIDDFKQWCWRRLLIQPVHPKGNQSWIFIGWTDAEAETLILWPPDAKNWFIGKDPDTGKDWRQEKRMTEDEMVGWHHRLNGHEIDISLDISLRDGDGHREAWHATVHRVAKSWTRLSDWTELRGRSMMMLLAPCKCPPDGGVHHHAPRGAADTQVSGWGGHVCGQWLCYGALHHCSVLFVQSRLV